MLIQFSVSNFRSINSEVTFDLRKTGIEEYDENCFTTNKVELLKSAMVYGANASGKSNLILALDRMKQIVNRSAKFSSDELLPFEPFLLAETPTEQPTKFEIIFQLNDSVYTYGFSYNKVEIIEEWLLQNTNGRSRKLFIRDTNGLTINAKFPEGKKLVQFTKPNTLFLSLTDQFNLEISKEIKRWFDRLTVISGNYLSQLTSSSINFLQSEQYNERFQKFINLFDLGFSSMSITEIPLSNEDGSFSKKILSMLSENIAEYNPEKTKSLKFITQTHHNVFDINGVLKRTELFDLNEQESEGTKKIFDLSGKFFEILENGGVAFIDELDAKLHPLLTLTIIKIFHSAKLNPKNAQLVFTTHDTNLMHYGNFRRDQIYFTEKNRESSTILYSLYDFKMNQKSVRKDRDFENDYILGRYGAIPYFGDIESILGK